MKINQKHSSLNHNGIKHKRTHIHIWMKRSWLRLIPSYSKAHFILTSIFIGLNSIGFPFTHYACAKSVHIKAVCHQIWWHLFIEFTLQPINHITVSCICGICVYILEIPWTREEKNHSIQSSWIKKHIFMNTIGWCLESNLISNGMLFAVLSTNVHSWSTPTKQTHTHKFH